MTTMIDVKTETQKSVQAMLNANEPFTSACISHPIIHDDSSVRHSEVKQAIRSMWQHGQMIAGDGSQYTRTSVTVWPEGPGSTPWNAWLYHPDSYDANTFKSLSRVLVRNDDSDNDNDATVSIANTADGSTIQQQCQIQKVETTLNVPRTIIKKIGWKAGDYLSVEIIGASVIVKKGGSDDKKRVDAEGRIRLHGAPVQALQTTSPIALLVDPTGSDKYIQVSDIKSLTTPSGSLSVWDK